MHIETRYLLNIGLRFAIGDRRTAGLITPGAVLHELYGVLDQSPVKILAITHVQAEGDREETAVVELDAAPSHSAVYTLSVTLWQDCIACFDLETGEGELIGRRTAEWGAFDPCLFVMPNGQPLDREERPEGQWHRPEHPVLDAWGVISRVPFGTYAGQPFANPQPNPLNADTADFSDFGDCTKLATLGVFATDRTEHKARRSREAAEALTIAGAYHWLGLNRRAESSRIQSEVAGLLPEGIWPRSSRLYSDRMHALDQHVLARAERQGYAS